MLAAVAFNLTRAAETVASKFNAEAPATRNQLIKVLCGTARCARPTRLQMPGNWPGKPFRSVVSPVRHVCDVNDEHADDLAASQCAEVAVRGLRRR